MARIALSSPVRAVIIICTEKAKEDRHRVIQTSSDPLLSDNLPLILLAVIVSTAVCNIFLRDAGYAGSAG